MKRILFTILFAISSHAYSANPQITEVDANATQIMEAANLAIKTPVKRTVVGNTMTFQALVPIKVNMGFIFPNYITDMTIDMTIIAKDGKFKIESSNPVVNGRACYPGAIQEDHVPACHTGIIGMQSLISGDIVRQLAKKDF